MKVEVYMDAKSEFRWRLKANNGRIIADGGEGYKTRGGLLGALRRMTDSLELFEAFRTAMGEVQSLKKLKGQK